MQRREFIKYVTAGLTISQLPELIAAQNKTTQSKKLIWIILRGGMDSIDVVVPKFEHALNQYRPTSSKIDTSSLLHLNNDYALHPSLSNLYQLYKQGQFSPIIAVGSGYQNRSHFEGQDYLESGMPEIDHDTGWLGRALNINNYSGLSISNAIPISLRSSDQINTWYPSNLKSSTEEIYRQLNVLYQEDEILLSRLQEGLDIRTMSGATQASKRRYKFSDLCNSCAKLISGSSSFQCATLELGGWDTHSNQKPRLARKLTELDEGLQTLKQGLAEHWDDTVIVCATEFGRTVKENGTGGTDHGSASAMFILGGAVNGGNVLGKWPGIAEHELLDRRDLKPTTSVLSWLATVFKQHWHLDNQAIKQIFPAIQAYDTKIIR